MHNLLMRIKKRATCSGFLLLLIPVFCFAQTSKIKELEQKLAHNMPDTARLRLLGKMCIAYTSVDPLKKLAYARQYKALADKLNDRKAVADAYIHMGISYGIRSMPDSALYFFDVAYFDAEKTNDWLSMGRSLADIGYTYDRMSDYRQSIKYYFRALGVFTQHKYEKGINQCSANIGSTYFDLKQYKLAESYFMQCYNSYKASNDEAGMGYAMFTLGNCYTEMGKYAKALDLFTKSLAIRQKLGDNNGTALVLKGLGNLYNHQQQYDKALELLAKAHKMVIDIKDKYEQGAILSDMADACLGKKDYDLVIKYASQSLALSRSIKNSIGITGALRRIVKAYSGKNDIAKAFDYQTAYVAAQDSMLDDNALKDVTLTEYGRIRSQNAELAENNRQIATENLTNKARVSHYGNLIIIISVVLIAVALLLVLQYRRNVEKQTANRLLMKQKAEIDQINKELASLNEEVTTQMELTASQNAELEHLNNVKNKFFSIVSHDLRGPISSIQSLFSIYRNNHLDADELEALLPKLEDTIISTGAFLDNLLEWSKSQLEGIRINTIDFNVTGLINENIRLWESRISLKKLKVTNLAQSTVMAHADQNMINLVIRNLLSNSVKFCNEGNEIKLDATNKHGKTLISINDNGPGISHKEQEKLFSLEHTISTGTQGEKGNHLGLILCRDMVTQNNGRLWYESIEGEGTTFWVELPAGS